MRVVEAGSSEAEAWAHLVIDAYGLPTAVLGWTRSLVGADGWHAWLALEGDEPAAAAAVWIGGDAAYFSFAATAAGASWEGRPERCLCRANRARAREGMRHARHRDGRVVGRSARPVLPQTSYGTGSSRTTSSPTGDGSERRARQLMSAM